MLRQRNPDDPALLSRVKLKITKSRSRVDVRAYDGAQMVGGAIFVRAPWTAQRHEKNVLESLSTEVLKPYQRKGLASLIYRTLTAQGFTIHPSSSQTWAGQQLWEGGRWPGKREVYQKRYPSTWKEKVATLRTNPEVGSTLRAMTARAFPGRSAHDVNRGDCDTWARKARSVLRGGQMIYLLDQYGVFEEYTTEPDGWGHDPSQKDHAVLLYRGKYYDAEDPDGVPRVRDLAYVRVGGRRRNPGETKSIEDQMVKAYGVSPYADVMRAWILPDGRILDLDRRDAEGVVVANLEHDLMLPTYFERAGHPRYGYDKAMTVFMDLTGSIRLADGGRGAMFHLAKVPTPAQVTACGKIAAAHAAMDQDSIEVYYQPADRLLEVRPISAGKVRRILEALPGLPPAAAPRAKPRRNPPRDVDTLQALGDECAVWAIAAATGRTVPEVRRAFLAGGDDIWLTKGGYGSGASMRQIRAVIRRLDWDHRIVGIGQALTLGNGPRALFTQYQSDLFVRGRRRGQIGADEFDVPEGVKDGVTRSMGPEAAVREVDGVTTIGMLVDQAKRDGLSLLAVTVNARRSRGSYTFRGHIMGYAPGRGLYDTSVRSKAAVAKILDGRPSEVITGLDYAAHGDDVPQRMRPAVLWVFFKPA